MNINDYLLLKYKHEILETSFNKMVNQTSFHITKLSKFINKTYLYVNRIRLNQTKIKRAARI